MGSDKPEVWNVLEIISIDGPKGGVMCDGAGGDRAIDFAAARALDFAVQNQLEPAPRRRREGSPGRHGTVLPGSAGSRLTRHETGSVSPQICSFKKTQALPKIRCLKPRCCH